MRLIDAHVLSSQWRFAEQRCDKLLPFSATTDVEQDCALRVVPGSVTDNVLRCSLIRTTGCRTDLADFRPTNVHFFVFMLSMSTLFGPG